MKENTQMGLNRTGLDASPVDARAMLEGVEEMGLPGPGSDRLVAENRIRFMEDSGGVGSVPVPGTIKGVVKAGVKALQGHSPTVLVDKLGERLAFERTGTRLYDALLSKREGADGDAELPPMALLQRFRDDEHRHFLAVRDVILGLGADPTAQTPAADVASVASAGLLQVVSDPRTSFQQSLEAVLIAELSDNTCWETLVELVREAGLEVEAERFERCLMQEEEHLAEVRQWVRRMTLAKAEPRKAAAAAKGKEGRAGRR